MAFVFANANAHNPNTASVVISPVKGIWMVQYTISQQGANYALNKHFKNTDLHNLSLKKYKELYIKYIKEHTSLWVDEQKTELASGGIRLGNHQTDMKFLIPNFPKNYEKVKLQLNIFDENDNQNTVVKFVEQNKSFRKVLNHENNFTLTFQNTGTAYVGDSDNEINKQIYYLLGFTFLAIATIIFFQRKKAKTESDS